MTLTLEITDEQLTGLMDALRVDWIDYKLAMHGQKVEQARVMTEYEYAVKILIARNILELSRHQCAACVNAPTPEVEWNLAIPQNY